AAATFCRAQLAGALRLLPDNQGVPMLTDGSLEELSGLAASKNIIDNETHARLLELADRVSLYEPGPLDSYDARFDRHVAETELLTSEHALLTDARSAVITVLRLVSPGN